MADLVLTDLKIYIDGYDFSAYHNQANLTLGTETADNTCYGDDSRNYKPGLKSFTFEHSGFADFADNSQDEVFVDTLFGTSDKVLTVCPTGTEAEAVYFAKQVLTKYELTGMVGEMCGFAGAGVSQVGPSGIIRGTLMETGAQTATGNGTARQLGAVSATQYLYAVIHCTAVSGTGTPTITVKVQSDDNESFTSATDRITFTAITAIGAQWATRVSGAITDDWWRINMTVTGTTPSLTIHTSVGIQ